MVFPCSITFTNRFTNSGFAAVEVVEVLAVVEVRGGLVPGADAVGVLGVGGDRAGGVFVPGAACDGRRVRADAGAVFDRVIILRRVISCGGIVQRYDLGGWCGATLCSNTNRVGGVLMVMRCGGSWLIQILERLCGCSLSVLLWDIAPH